MDDGSDEPVVIGELIESIQSPLKPSIQILRQENAGPGRARNQGAEIGRGVAFAFIDDDCIAKPNWVEELLDASARNENALVGGWTLNAVLDDPYAAVNQLILDIVYAHHNIDHQNSVFLASNNWLCPKQAFFDLGGFKESFKLASEDRDFCERWLASGRKIIWHRQAIIEHFHGQNLTTFLSMHLRYGRGAFAYHSSRNKRSGQQTKSTLSFYRALPSMAIAHLKREPRWATRFQISSLLILWQLTNCCGFFLEMLKRSMHTKK